MNDKLKYGLIGLLLGGFLVLIGAAISVNSNNTGMMRNSNTIDAHFIEQMIPHHEDAITMAKLAETKAKTEEVRQLSKNIINSQGKEIDQMKAWYKQWFGREVPQDTIAMQHHGMGSSNGMHMGMTGTTEDLTRLENAEDFDKAFVEHMIPHHQMAVMMATMLKNGTDRPEMKKLADDIITAQTKEIKQMRMWLREW